MQLDVSQTDWALLKQQKTSLLKVINHLAYDRCCFEDGEQAVEHLDGIVYLIDHIQDTAALQLGESVVFPPYRYPPYHTKED